jgi:hypothetical protein
MAALRTKLPQHRGSIDKPRLRFLRRVRKSTIVLSYAHLQSSVIVILLAMGIALIEEITRIGR